MNNKKINHLTLAVLASAVVLSGCASQSRTGYRCPIGHEGTGSCISMEEVYKHAVSHSGPSPKTGSVIESSAGAGNSSTTPNPFAYGLSPYNETLPAGRPVYEPPRVFRPWVAPSQTGDGRLASGQFQYFATEGKWSYGSMAPQRSDSLFTPARPNDYGFNPVEDPKAKGSLTVAPATGASTVQQTDDFLRGANSQQMRNARGPAPGTKQVNGITQPYTRIGAQ